METSTHPRAVTGEAVERLAVANGWATPCYVYDMDLLETTACTAMDSAGRCGITMDYAVKACNERPVLQCLAAMGLGADTVSGGEIRQALEAGFAPGAVHLAGVAKTDADLDLALSRGIGCLMVESIEELDLIAARARCAGHPAPVALRINPHIDAHTHKHITTGLAENKFGIDITLFDRALDRVRALEPWLTLRGLHFHIGSQIIDTAPWQQVCRTALDLTHRVIAAGFEPDMLDLGGGLGVDYDNPGVHPVPAFDTWIQTVHKGLEGLDSRIKVHLEPGRALTAQCGWLLTRVVLVKHGLEKRFVLTDGGMTHLMRPALYGALHRIDNLTRPTNAPVKVDIAGPVCESTDVLAHDYIIPGPERGDMLAVRSAGAYGQSMASHYNSMPLKPTHFVWRQKG